MWCAHLARKGKLVTNHLAALSAKHAQIEASLHQETLRPMPDTVRVARLKREKLRIKEEMSLTA
ncbi:DUF465 domain-containing protein [Polymorphobacter arshaanensis]|uniref:DUF465 domain-containing protein n=1 Tax=Glacieibacterium arshaanense TaxID=2511025 RepID=A0A4Y9EME0_9SPHN|nr:DUF465 domain-containing protein [Polymorphobacter arshaanensis]